MNAPLTIDISSRQSYVLPYNIAMKTLSFLVVLNIIFCYTGLGATVCHSLSAPNAMNAGCHTTQDDEGIATKTAEEHSYKNSDSTKHTMLMCHDALPTATHGYDVSLKDILSYVAVVNLPDLEINRVSTFHLNHETKKEYRPPDLFLLNSSFLI